MNFYKIFLYFNLFSVCNSYLNNNIIKNSFTLKNNNYLIKNTRLLSKNKQINFNDKIYHYKKLLRTNNIIPTLLLNTLGSYLINSSFSKHFLYSSLITQSLMMSSMAFNDIFDLNVDKINNPTRPLPSKKVTIIEASLLAISFLLIGNYISYINNQLKITIPISIILLLYTPIFKRICFVKNIVCASIISLSVLITSNFTFNRKVILSTSLLFLSSLCTELLLDIRDMKGDALNNIITVPVKFGIHKTMNFIVFLILSSMILSQSLIFIISLIPLLNSVINTYYNHFSKETVIYAVNSTMYTLIIYLISIFIFTPMKI